MNRHHANRSGAGRVSVEEYSLDNEDRWYSPKDQPSAMSRGGTAFALRAEPEVLVIDRVERSRSQATADPFRLRREFALQARTEVEELALERTLELENAQRDMVARLALAGEYRDDGTGEHPRRVGRNAAAIARELGWPEEEASVLESAALLHDVGKIGIRDTVLLKPGRLSKQEFEHMKTHTTVGARILSGGKSRLLRLAEEIALAHHERWDGEGYPLGLAGTEIPLSARIVAVADVLDALTHERPYKEAWPLAKALREIDSQSGAQFDPMVVRACQRVFDNAPVPRHEVGRNRGTADAETRHAAEPALVFGLPSLEP